MTVARQGSPILDPDLRSQPLRSCAPTKTLSGEAAVNLKNPRGESPVKPQNPHARQGVSISKKSAHLTMRRFLYSTETSSILKFSSFPAISWLASKVMVVSVFAVTFTGKRWPMGSVSTTRAPTGSSEDPGI